MRYSPIAKKLQIIDIGQPLDQLTLTPTTTAPGAALNVHLDTENLGGSDEAYINIENNPGGTWSNHAAWGVALCPTNNIGLQENESISVEISINALMPQGNSLEIYSQIYGFIGYLDSGDTAVNGFGSGAQNGCTNYHIIGVSPPGDEFKFNETIILKDVVSGGLDEDLKIIVGIIHDYATTAAAIPLQFNISARYAINAVSIPSGVA